MNFIKYNRTFVMMEQQSDTFALKEGPVKGYLKVETGNNKGALRCAVQNLKVYDQEEYVYKLMFFGKKGGRTIHAVIGDLIVNRQGNGETYFRFHPLDMDGRGTRYDEYQVAIIAAMSSQNTEESLHPVLKGNMNGENNQPVEQPKAASRNGRERPVAPAPTPEAGTGKPKSKNFNHFYNLYLLLNCAQTGRNGEFFGEVSPFDERFDKTRARWKKIINVSGLPLVSPGAHYFATRYHHFLYGIRSDDHGNPLKYYFGIPGRFLEEEQPDGGQSGFTCWQAIRKLESQEDGGVQAKNSAYGYWIVAVDAYTGDIESV